MSGQLPLQGLRVLDLASFIAGPVASTVMGDYGAEVIKIEPPGEGDPQRKLGQAHSIPQHPVNFCWHMTNRNKRSVVLDLKDPAQKQAARQLILSADVVLENNRPGVMDRLGLGYESFRAEKPGLVYCSISAFGQSGPRSSEGGFDVTVQAMSGIMSVTGEPDGAPVKCGVPKKRAFVAGPLSGA